MFKSCLYCRHRKKKCVLPPSSAFDRRCFACQHLDLVCEIHVRKPSLKRQRKSQQIATKLSAQSNPAGSNQSSPESPTSVGQRNSGVGESNDGDCQVRRPDNRTAAKKLIMSEDFGEWTEELTTREKYQDIIRPKFPFIPDDFPELGEGNISPVLKCCIDLSAQLCLQNGSAGISDAALRHLSNLLENHRMDLAQAAGLSLLLPRMHLDQNIVEKVFSVISAPDILQDMPLPIAAGSLTAQTWLNLVGHATPPINLPSSILVDYGASLDQTTFGPHYLKLTHLAANFLDLRNETEQGDITLDIIQAWAKLEYSCLLNVAQMPSEFLDVRDDMPASPAAITTHMLQSLIYLSIYCYVLFEKPSLAPFLGLRPVPGVLHFICAIARSIFVCPSEIIENWTLFGDLQATTAQIILNFWDLTKFENCRALLNLWQPASSRFDSLKGIVDQQIGPGPWAIDFIDGYSVFWTFRDLRSLSLEMHMRH